MSSRTGPHSGFTDDEKDATRAATSHAIKRGALVVAACCAVCGCADRIQTHHTDYGDPFAVVRLCWPHHRQVHDGRIEEPTTGRWYPPLQTGPYPEAVRVGRMIRSFRELFGMTQVEFAGLAKGNRYGKPRSSSAVSGVEAGKTPVSAPASAAIRDAMGWYA